MAKDEQKERHPTMERVYQAGREAGLFTKPTELALLLGETPQTVTNWSRPERGISQRAANAVSAIVGRSVQWILTGVEGPEYAASNARGVRLIKDEIDVPRLSVNGSMGKGAEQPDHEEVIGRISVNREWLRRSLHFSAPANLRVITGFGDSMEKTFSDGDLLLVDAGVSDIKIDAVYVLLLNDQIFIKRLQRRPDGALLMISDNKNYEPYLISNGEREQLRILGRVLLAWNARKL